MNNSTHRHPIDGDGSPLRGVGHSPPRWRNFGLKHSNVLDGINLLRHVNALCCNSFFLHRWW